MNDIVDAFDDIAAWFGRLDLDGVLWLAAFIPVVLIGIWVRQRFRGVLDRYLQTPTQNGVAGIDVARRLLEQAGVRGVRIVPVPGCWIRDHYHPLTKELGLSSEIHDSSSIAAVAIAAHEAAHAIQHARQYTPAWVRLMSAPAQRIGFYLGMLFIGFGMIQGASLTWIGGAVLCCCLVFEVLRLQVERNASARAPELALRAGVIEPAEQAGMDEVLRAAAWTYMGRVMQMGLALVILSAFLVWHQPPAVADFESLPGLISVVTVVLMICIPLARIRHRKTTVSAADWNNAGLRHADQDRPAEAIAAYTRALQMDPRLAQAYYNRGVSYYRTAQFDEALADLDRAICLGLTHAPAFTWRGNVHSVRQEFPEASADYTAALRVHPDNLYALIGRGRAEMAQGNYPSALADFERVIALRPDDPNGYVQRGHLWCARGDLAQAMADLDRALQRDATHGEAYASRGAIWLTRSDLNRAIEDFSAALQHNYQMPAVYRDRGLARLLQGDPAGALADLDKAIGLHPGDAIAHNNRGVALTKLGDYGPAVAELQEAIRIEPELANSYKNLAWIQATCPEPGYRQGAEAVRNAQRALELKPAEAASWREILAAAYAEAGDFASAEWVQRQCVDECTPDRRAEMERRLEQYRRGEPFRDQPTPRSRLAAVE